MYNTLKALGRPNILFDVVSAPLNRVIHKQNKPYPHALCVCFSNLIQRYKKKNKTHSHHINYEKGWSDIPGIF